MKRVTHQYLVMLMEGFLHNKLNADEFVDQFIFAWKMIQGEMNQVVASVPHLSELTISLKNDLYEGIISPEEFSRKHQAVFESLRGQLTILPFSRESDALDHLMVEADAFNGDDNSRTKYEIDEKKLREAVEATYQLIRENLI